MLTIAAQSMGIASLHTILRGRKLRLPDQWNHSIAVRHTQTPTK